MMFCNRTTIDIQKIFFNLMKKITLKKSFFLKFKPNIFLSLSFSFRKLFLIISIPEPLSQISLIELVNCKIINCKSWSSI